MKTAIITAAQPDPKVQIRKQAKRKVDSLNQKIDQARQTKQSTTDVDQRRDLNGKIRDSHKQLDQVRNDRDKQLKTAK